MRNEPRGGATPRCQSRAPLPVLGGQGWAGGAVLTVEPEQAQTRSHAAAASAQSRLEHAPGEPGFGGNRTGRNCRPAAAALLVSVGPGQDLLEGQIPLLEGHRRVEVPVDEPGQGDPARESRACPGAGLGRSRTIPRPAPPRSGRKPRWAIFPSPNGAASPSPGFVSERQGRVGTSWGSVTTRAQEFLEGQSRGKPAAPALQGVSIAPGRASCRRVIPGDLQQLPSRSPPSFRRVRRQRDPICPLASGQEPHDAHRPMQGSARLSAWAAPDGDEPRDGCATAPQAKMGFGPGHDLLHRQSGDTAFDPDSAVVEQETSE